MDLPPYATFLDGKNMSDFWQAVKYFLFFIAPVFMIWVAVEVVGWVLKIVRNTADESERQRHDDEDDDYYYYRDRD